MSCLLQAAWVTQASDFITQNWDKLLGIIGGSGGIIAVVTLIGKILLTCLQGRISRKNMLPLQMEFNKLKEEVMTFVVEVEEKVKSLMEEQTENLKEVIQEIMDKAQKIKTAIYDKLVTEGEDAQQLLNDLNAKTEELQRLINSEEQKVEQTAIDEEIVVANEISEQKNDHQDKNMQKIQRKQKIIVER